MKKKIITYMVFGFLAVTLAIVSGCNLPGDAEYTLEDLVFRLDSEDGQVLEDGTVIDIDVSADPGERYAILITVPDGGSIQAGLGFGIEYNFTPVSYYNWSDIITITSTHGTGEIRFGDPNNVKVTFSPFQSEDRLTMIADGTYDIPLTFVTDSNEKIFEVVFRAEFNNSGDNHVVYNVPGDIHASEVWGKAYLFDGSTSAKLAATIGRGLGGGTAWDLPLPLLSYFYPSLGKPNESVGNNYPFIPDGAYYSLFHIDADENGALNVGEKGVFKSVTVAGDLLIEITEDELSAAVTESFSMINGGSLPDGALVIRFVVPNGGEPDMERDQVTYSIASLSSGSLTPFADGPVIPGTYGIFAYIDEEPGYNFSSKTTDWDLDVGEYYLELGEVVIDGSGVVLDGSQFVQLN